MRPLHELTEADYQRWLETLAFSIRDGAMLTGDECAELHTLLSSGGWKLVSEDSPESVVGGAPVTAGMTIYTFDPRGMWVYQLPKLPTHGSGEEQ